MTFRHRAAAGVRRLLAGGLLTVALSAAAHAAVVVPLSLSQLTEAAQLVVDGTVLEVRHVEGPAGAERVLLVRVRGAWKGHAAETVHVRLAGGRIGRLETRVPGTPRIEPGERLVWFLTPDPRGGFIVVGLHQGALRTTGVEEQVRVLAPAPTATARGDVRRGWRNLDALAAEVRRLAEVGP